MPNVQLHVIHPSENKHFDAFDSVEEYYVPYGQNAYTYSRNVRDFLFRSGGTYDIGYADGFSLWLYLKHRRFPCVFNHHGYHFSQPHFVFDQMKRSPARAMAKWAADWLRELVARYNVKHSDFVVSESATIYDILTNKYGCDARKIINSSVAVDPADFSQKSQTTKVQNSFLFVGSLIYRKGITYLIDAFESLHEESFHLYIVGDGYLKTKFSFRDNNKIVILGRVSDVELASWYSRSECFVFSGLAESGPIVVLEAMAHGLPIIATDVGAVRKMIDGNGFVIPTGDAGAIRTAVKRFMLLDREARVSMGQRSRSIVEDNFTWGQVAADFYQDLKRITSHLS
jgi:glycosyltransferase involved in cell wall biosynthesis